MAIERKKENLMMKEYLLPVEFAFLMGLAKCTISQNMSNNRYEIKLIGSKVYIKNSVENKSIHNRNQIQRNG
jgi:hypothetical protein